MSKRGLPRRNRNHMSLTKLRSSHDDPGSVGQCVSGEEKTINLIHRFSAKTKLHVKTNQQPLSRSKSATTGNEACLSSSPFCSSTHTHIFAQTFTDDTLNNSSRAAKCGLHEQNGH